MKTRTSIGIATGIGVALAALSCVSASAAVARSSSSVLEAIAISSEEAFPAPRWMYGTSEPPKGDNASSLMASARRAQIDGNAEACLKKAEAAYTKAKSVQAWIVLVELQCALKLAPGPQAADRMQKPLDLVEKNPAWLLNGPQAEDLRAAVIQAGLAALEQDVKTQRTRASLSVERLEGWLADSDEKTHARFWAAIGELAFVTQHIDEARELYRRSLAAFETDDVRTRLNTIDSMIAPAKGAEKTSDGDDDREARTATKNANAATLESSKEELELVDRVTAELKAGSLVPAVEDAANIIVKFPGGTRAKWAADRIAEAYWSIADKTDAKYAPTKALLLKTMQRADADRLADWARTMFNRGQWKDSLEISRKAFETAGGARSTAMLDTAVRAALASDQFDVARQLLDRMILQHAGSQQAREGLFRSGLLHYRLKEYAQAISDFERLLVLPNPGQFEMLARYWLWRTLQKTKAPTADAVADELMRKAPFSYYGLRARLERTDGTLEWKVEASRLKTQLWLTAGERKTWARAQLLMKAGWLEEAQAELRQLPLPRTAEDKAIRALVWAAAGQYVTASRLANEAWDEKPEFRRPPFVTSAFPMEFEAEIDAQSAQRKLDRYLVRGLIKQESGYNPRAVSPANAYGLMQIVGPTAKELAADMKLASLALPEDMYQPTRNIQMGTLYLSRLMTKYQGSVPLALAAYNAGPARMDRWLRDRPSLKNLASVRSSAADDEIWIDEIPYWETSVYVKAILRNVLIYKMLDVGRVKVGDPIWSSDVTP